MRAEIISIGEELLSGDSDIIDTNSIYITRLLREIGVRVHFKTTVGDHIDRITESLLTALSRADVIITSGGLGPTVDDMTRQGVANAVGQALELRDDLLREIAAKFERIGVRMSDNNRVQAMLPVGAIPIHNPVGTAPGFIVEYAGRSIISVPGVPREMRHMMDNTVIPYVTQKRGFTGIIKTRVLRTAGIGESMLDEQIGEFEKLENPVVGLAAHTGQVDIRLYATAETEAEADRMIAEIEAQIRERVGTYIFGVDRDSLETAFVAALQRAGVKLVLAETGTDHMLRALLEKQPPADGLIETVTAEAIATLKAQYTRADHRDMTKAVAGALWEQHRPALVIVVFADADGTATAISNGQETRSRAYGFGSAAAAGTTGIPVEWAARWGLSMAWWLVSSMKPSPQP